MKLFEIAELVEVGIVEKKQAQNMLGFILRGETLNRLDEKDLEIIGVKLDFSEVEEYYIEYDNGILGFDAI